MRIENLDGLGCLEDSLFRVRRQIDLSQFGASRCLRELGHTDAQRGRHPVAWFRKRGYVQLRTQEFGLLLTLETGFANFLFAWKLSLLHE